MGVATQYTSVLGLFVVVYPITIGNAVNAILVMAVLLKVVHQLRNSCEFKSCTAFIIYLLWLLLNAFRKHSRSIFDAFFQLDITRQRSAPT